MVIVEEENSADLLEEVSAEDSFWLKSSLQKTKLEILYVFMKWNKTYK